MYSRSAIHNVCGIVYAYSYSEPLENVPLMDLEYCLLSTVFCANQLHYERFISTQT